ncbi:hypothetical protein L9F63_001350, partial [Diploptera punctata]
AAATILATSSGAVHPGPQQCISGPRFIVLKYLYGCFLSPHEKSALISSANNLECTSVQLKQQIPISSLEMTVLLQHNLT